MKVAVTFAYPSSGGRDSSFAPASKRLKQEEAAANLLCGESIWPKPIDRFHWINMYSLVYTYTHTLYHTTKLEKPFLI